MVINEPVQTDKPKPVLVENENFELVKFKQINNYLTHGSIIRTYLPIHYHKDVLIKFNYVLDYNDQMTHLVKNL
jgi:hypothetical protein